MPVVVQNNFPTVKFSLGSKNAADKEVKSNVLFDTYGALITGYKLYHNHIKRLHPEVVHEYDTFDSTNPFDPIKLSRAV
jgi:hypothetical protein